MRPELAWALSARQGVSPSFASSFPLRFIMADHTQPLIIDITRGRSDNGDDFVESRHRCHVAVVKRDGSIAHRWGDIDQPIYGRSAIKPILALGLVESGAADAFQLSDAEIALACASLN